MLIVLSGLPGAGKTSIARELARAIGAVHVRVDSIEDAMRASGSFLGPLDDAGYRVAYAVATDNLRLGRTVIADSVNPLGVTRAAWREVAGSARCFEVEVRCSDPVEHRRRVEERGWPSWNEVAGREYHAWDREHVVIDTAGRPVEACVRELRATMGL